MSGNERLGFEFHIDEKSNAPTIIDGLLTSLNSIKTALKDMGFANLTKAMEGLGNIAPKLQASSQAFSGIDAGAKNTASNVDAVTKSIITLKGALDTRQELRIKTDGSLADIDKIKDHYKKVLDEMHKLTMSPVTSKIDRLGNYGSMSDIYPTISATNRKTTLTELQNFASAASRVLDDGFDIKGKRKSDLRNYLYGTDLPLNAAGEGTTRLYEAYKKLSSLPTVDHGTGMSIAKLSNDLKKLSTESGLVAFNENIKAVIVSLTKMSNIDAGAVVARAGGLITPSPANLQQSRIDAFRATGANSFTDIHSKDLARLATPIATETVERLNWQKFKSQNQEAINAISTSTEDAKTKMSAAWKAYKAEGTEAVGAVEQVVGKLKHNIAVVADANARAINDTKKVEYSAVRQDPLNPALADSHVKLAEEQARKSAAIVANEERKAWNTRIAEQKELLKSAGTQEEQMNAMFRLEKLQKEKAALRQRTADIKQAIADELAEEKKKQVQIDAMHRRSTQPTSIKTVDGNALTDFARGNQSTIWTNHNAGIDWLNGSAPGISKVTQLADAFQKLGSISVAKAKEEMDKFGISVKSLSSAEMNKLEDNFKKVGLHINRATGEIKTLNEASKGMFSFLPDTLGKMATRLTEFYSIRAVLFSVSSEFKQATSAAIELNQSVHDILGISGESKDKFGMISESIYAIAKTSRYTAQEVAASMQVLAQAGVAAKDLPYVSKQTDWFATATAADPKLAADLVTTSMNVYSIDATEVTRVTNAMTAALNLSKLETQGLATAFNYLAPQSAQLGMSMEQTLGIIANMAQSGIKASTIGTGISQMLKEFAAPKPRLRNMLKEVGLSPEDVNPMKKNFADIVETLQKSGVTVDKLFAAMETRVGRAAVTAINLSAESFRSMEANLTGTHAALIAYDKTMEGAKARMNVTKQSFQELATTIGSSLAPSLIFVTGALQDIIAIFSSDDSKYAKLAMEVLLLSTAFGALTIASRALAASSAMSGVLSVIRELPALFTSARLSVLLLSSGMTTLPQLFKMATVGVLEFTAALLTNPATWIAIGLAALAYGIYKVVDSLGEERRAREASTKAQLEQIDSNERLLRASNDMLHSTKESSAAYEKYKAAIKEGSTHEQAIVLAKTKSITATKEQMKALSDFVAAGGPQAKVIQGYIQENQLVQANIELQRIKRREMGMQIRNAVTSYNAAASQQDFTGDAIKKVAKDTSVLGPDAVKKAYESGKPEIVRRVKEAEALLRTNWDKKRPESALLSNSVGGMYAFNGDENSGNGLLLRDGTTGGYKSIFVEDPKKPKTGPDSATTGKPKFDGTMIDPKIQLDIANKNDEKQALILSLKTSYHDSGEIKDIIQEINDLDEEIAKLTGDKEEGKVRKELKNTKGWTDKAKNTWATDPNIKVKYTSMDDWYNQSIEAAKERDAASLNKLKEANKKLEEDTEKVYREHNLAIAKLKEDAHKTAIEAEQKNLEKELSDGYVGSTQRTEDLLKAKLNATRLIVAKYSKEIESLKALLADPINATNPQAVKDINGLIEGKKLDQKTEEKESHKGFDVKALAGAKANYDIQISNATKKLEIDKAQLSLLEKQALGYENIKKLQLESLELSRKTLDANEDLAYEKYAKVYDSPTSTQDEIDAAYEQYEKIHQQLADINYEIGEKSQGAWGNFIGGAKDAYNEMSNIDKLSRDLGKNLYNEGINGTVSAIKDGINTAFNPDKQKIADINQSIADLTIKRYNLQQEINLIEANSNKTPQELKDLRDKKVALAGINSELNKQSKALDKQKDGWGAFADGMKKAVLKLLEMLQEYILKLIVTRTAETLVKGLFGEGGLIGGEPAAPTGEGVPGMANGGKVRMRGYAPGGFVDGTLGGFIPTNMGTPGKDSVPIMAMPGEIVIKKSSVDKYGADKLLDINAGRLEKFAEGGAVSSDNYSSKDKAPAKSESSQGYTLQIVNVASMDQIPKQQVDAKQVVNIIQMDAAARGPVYRTIKAAAAG